MNHGDENYSITLAVAGFSEDEIDINVENQIMTIKGKNHDENMNQTIFIKELQLDLLKKI